MGQDSSSIRSTVENTGSASPNVWATHSAATVRGSVAASQASRPNA
ncbi:MAG TPA: hypothetical protein VFE59_11890 [Trebonia sp.]|nr:hypothetical protein [Trebonia sp.]